MDTPWADSNSYNISELNTIQGGIASPCLSSSLPFCVRFNVPVTSHAATLNTKPLAKSYLDGVSTRWSSIHFQYARPSDCYVFRFEGQPRSSHSVQIVPQVRSTHTGLPSRMAISLYQRQAFVGL